MSDRETATLPPPPLKSIWTGGGGGGGAGLQKPLLYLDDCIKISQYHCSYSWQVEMTRKMNKERKKPVEKKHNKFVEFFKPFFLVCRRC